MHDIVKKLVALIKTNGWTDDFALAIRNAQAHDVPGIADLQTLDDYLRYVDELVTWTPRENVDSRCIHDHLVKFYFILDQPPLKALQSPITPGTQPQVLTPLSAWIVEFARAWGSYLDTLESAWEVDGFRADPAFNWDEYMPSPSGYKTFNQFFARHVKPGMRPVAAPCDDAVLVAPADSTFVGWWQVSERSTIQVNDTPLSIKGMEWSIHELLEGSEYADRFRGGIFTHSFLNTFDYHRWHAPVRGKVLEARVLQGQAYLDVDCRPSTVDGKTVNVLHTLDGTGYQFVQTRGLIVLESPAGLVACLPMGMAQVSSVVITAEVGVTLRKGEELGYFQFGGSDFVMVFERASNVELTSQAGVHYQQGTSIGNAYPV
ncbi:MAG: phosphatidylserine decarboxylase [Gemmatimonadetes bacterium]|nr:phosphatidylserine decarboxylase [Gemmatimonadota bacterium]